MPLSDLKFKPGINKEVTPYAEDNGWVDSDKIRFRFGFPEKLNGWTRNTNNNFLGVCRGLHEFVALNSDKFLGLGTEEKFYVKQGDAFNDVTPIRKTTTGTASFAGDVVSPFSSVITVTDPNHGAVVNDFVTFSGANGLGRVDPTTGAWLPWGNFTGDVLNQEYQIQSVINGNTYTVSARSKISIPEVTVSGGIDDSAYAVLSSPYDVGYPFTQTVVAVYQINTGINSSVQSGAGWGVGLWGGTTSNASVIAEFNNPGVTIAAGATTLNVPAATIGLISIGDILHLDWDGVLSGSFEINFVAGSRTITAVTTDWFNSTDVTNYILNSDKAFNQGSTNSPNIPNNVNIDSMNLSVGPYTAVMSQVALSTGTSGFNNPTAASYSELVQVTGIPSSTSLTVKRGMFGTPDLVHTNQPCVLAVGNANASNDYVGWGAAVNQDVLAPDLTLRLWSQDSFGENLLLNDRGGGIYFWDKFKFSNTTGYRSENIASLTDIAGNSVTRTSVPTTSLQVMLSDSDRHVIAFGCDGLGISSTDPDGDGVADPLLIRFSTSENPVEWYPKTTNTAGDLRLSSGSTIIQALETRQQILVFTDVSIHTMQFIGPPFTFGISLISENITIASPKAAVAVDDSVFWMGTAEFYVFTGAVQRIPCTVRDFVFDNMNTSQREKIIAGANVSFSEVWWFYPSNTVTNGVLNTENDSYVIYNYVEAIWYIGTMNRSAWLDRGISDFPLSTGDNNYLYNQESGAIFTDDSANAYIQSGDMRIDQGNNFSFIQRVIPDVNFRDQQASSSLNFVITSRNFPGQVYLNPASTTPLPSSTNAVVKTSVEPINQYTYQYFTRIRGRSFTFRAESSDQNVLWRLGIPRIEIRPDGRR
tara:strand:- start:539 stop:3148 length:2610 start_codon:yes stop_codon:yes gene_type:complete